MRFRAVVPALLALSWLSAAAGDPWLMQGHDAQRTGRSSASGPVAPQLKWSYDLASRVQDNASPVVGPDGTIYVPSEESFYAINPDGTLRWEKTYRSGDSWRMRSAPALSPDGSTVYALGSWLSSSDTHVRALNALNGDLLWEYGPLVGQVTYSSFAVGSDGTVFVGTWEPALYAINPNGTLKWRDSTSGRVGAVEAVPAVDSNGNVYVNKNLDGLLALDSNGVLKWRRTDVGGWYGWRTPAIGLDGTIYVADDSVYAIDPAGRSKWSRSIGDPGYFAGVAVSSDGSVIYTARSGGKVYALNAGTGQTVWASTIGDSTEQFGGSPVLSGNGILYVMGAGNRVYAVVASDGELLWQYTLSSFAIYWGPQSPALGPDGTLYVLSSGDLGIAGGVIPARLYAFYTPPPAGAIMPNPPSQLAFGGVQRGGSQERVFRISNVGGTTLSVSDISVGGVDVQDFAVRPSVAMIEPGYSQPVTVTFSPTSSGPKSAALSIVHNAVGSPSSVALSGIGTEPAPVMSASTTSLSFDNVRVGSSTARTFTVGNEGLAPLTVSQMTLAGVGATLYTATPATFTVDPGSPAQVVTVTFTPTLPGQWRATLSIVHNAAGSPAVVALSVTALPAPPAPTRLVLTRGNGEVGLTWGASGASDLSHYVVYRNRTGSSPTGTDSLARVAKTDTSYVSGGLSSLPVGTYYYWVGAVDSVANRALSSSVSVVV
ncbi:MAG: choice-of-anchor D domain-containing protein, partial [Candidatus Latescibacterota bacterium]